MEEVNISYRVLGFALVLGVVTGTAAGAVPAIGLNWRSLDGVLREGGRSGAGTGGRGRIRNILVTSEFALALTVLVCSALFFKSLMRLQGADLGVDPEGVATFRLRLPGDPYDQLEQADVFFTELEQQMAAIPGVSGVGISSALPPNRMTMTNNYTVEGQEPEPGESQPVAPWIIASHSYFEVLGIPLRLGRVFTGIDRTGQQGVVVVNEAFVQRHYPDRDPIGGRLKSGIWDPETPWLTIVGVVGDVFYEGADERVLPTVYQPLRQNLGWSSPFVALRTTGDDEAVVARARNVIAALDPRMPIRDVATIEQRISESNAFDRFRSLLISFLALVALIMAATGIYGVTAYNVGARRREHAIRRALGARSGRLVAGVMRDVLGFAAIGAMIGLAGAYAIALIFRSLLYDIGPADPIAYATATGILVAVAAAAGLIPSLRASEVDPVAALREE